MLAGLTRYRGQTFTAGVNISSTLSARIYAGLKVFRMMLGGWPGIDDSEREAIFFIADISGHTKFIFANEKEVSHSQMVIREIITSLMNRVVTPLHYNW